jgi:hypothetical protein
MAESLDKVLQPDGTYKWELVELRAANLYEKDKPKEVKSEPRAKRRTKSIDSTPVTTPDEY